MHEGGFNREWWKKSLFGVLIGLIVVWLVASCSSSEKSDAFTSVDAHVLCDEAIKSESLNRDLVKIPYQVARETDSAYGFLWGVEDGLKMPNAFGAQVGAVVICRVGKQSRKVEHLEINGETLTPR